MFSAAEGSVDVGVNILDGLVGFYVHADIAGIVRSIAVADDFAAQVDWNHPGDYGGLVRQEWPDGFGEMLQQKRVHRYASLAADASDLCGGRLIKGVPRDGGRRLGDGAFQRRP